MNSYCLLEEDLCAEYAALLTKTINRLIGGCCRKCAMLFVTEGRMTKGTL